MTPLLVPVLVGPTASGKTAVSLHLAQHYGASIISADSRQVYRFMDIGTAKPSAEERGRVRHYFVDERNPDQDFNAGGFGTQGRGIVDRLQATGTPVLVVGGSGLYVQSLIDGLFEGPGADREVRDLLEQRLAASGLPDLLDELRRVDPASASRIDPTKPRRVIRALEVFHTTGRPLSALHHESKPTIPFRSCLFGLLWDRKELYDRINVRCEAMLAAGFLDEVERLASMGYGPHLNALNTVGYAEAFRLRAGMIGRGEMLTLMQQNTRRYAKRQLTWFRRDQRIRWITMKRDRSPESVADEIAAQIGRLTQ